MQRTQNKVLFFALTLVLLLLVPSMLIYAGGSKALKNKLNACEEEKSSLESEVSQLKLNSERLESQIASLESEREDLKQRIIELESQLAAAQAQIEILEAEAPEPMIVAKTIEEQIQAKEAEIIELRMEKDELETEISQINREIAQLKSQNRSLESKNRSLESENRTAKMENERLTQRVATLEEDNEELEMVLEVYEGIERESIELMDIILERINELLYEEIRAGKVRVFKGTLGIVMDVVAEDMFDVGSVKINRGGRNILDKVGTLLSDLDGYLIGVMGNADDKPIVTPSLKRQFPTNWELSAARGATVTRYLIDVSGVSSSKFISMGLGEFQPIDTNRTLKGRGNNRRVDIVLLPLDVLAVVVVGAEVK